MTTWLKFCAGSTPHGREPHAYKLLGSSTFGVKMQKPRTWKFKLDVIEFNHKVLTITLYLGLLSFHYAALITLCFCQPALFTVSKLSRPSIDQLLELCELNCDSSCNDMCPFSWKYVFPEFQTWLITQFQSTRSFPMERYCPSSKKQGPVTFH